MKLKFEWTKLIDLIQRKERKNKNHGIKYLTFINFFYSNVVKDSIVYKKPNTGKLSEPGKGSRTPFDFTGEKLVKHVFSKAYLKLNAYLVLSY